MSVLDLDDGEFGNHLEVAEVASSDSVSEVESGGANQKIREWDSDSCGSSFGIDLRRELRHLSIERLHRHGRENRIQLVPPSSGLLRGLSSI